jgi:hypothetical protein
MILLKQDAAQYDHVNAAEHDDGSQFGHHPKHRRVRLWLSSSFPLQELFCSCLVHFLRLSPQGAADPGTRKQEWLRRNARSWIEEIQNSGHSTEMLA